MSKIIENFLVPLFLVISVLYAFHSFADNTNAIILNKAYHHMAPHEGYLEKANISLYFSGDPQVQEITNKKMNSSSFSFFFPNATMSQGECEAMVARINNYNGTYKVTISSATKPTRGIMVRFDCDPTVYLINCEQFDSIGLQKGFVFRLYNKELLTKLERANDQPVLRTLWHSEVPKRIIIDPGHGGRDTGAISHNGIQEKQVCLSIGTAVGNLLKQKGCSVMLTRNNDCDMQLDERTSYANDHHADLFVSIHANYASSRKALGVETFCMQPKLLSKIYSNFSQQEDSCVSNIMMDRINSSYALAQAVQQHTCAAILPFHDESIDRKVKYSVSQVLLGVQIPAILIEVGFLSHQKEAQLLADVHYQSCIARGICDGILSALSF
jgi:N-acetylmuramoyl-L-alanine amidase